MQVFAIKIPRSIDDFSTGNASDVLVAHFRNPHGLVDLGVAMIKAGYEFTNNWFEVSAKPTWERLLPKLDVSRVLEIGSYEGASTCFLIKNLAHRKGSEIHCVDNWEGGLEHKAGGFVESDMSEVEKRFLHNTRLAQEEIANAPKVVVHKGSSDLMLASLIASGRSNYFNLIYIDGSHQAPDVLADAVLSFRLLGAGGIMIFDDYLWYEKLPGGLDPIRCPKIAIDAFTNIYCRKIRLLQSSNNQIYLQKLGDI